MYLILESATKGGTWSERAVPTTVPNLGVLSCFLTLIQPGEVKVDLTNFDVKFRAKLFYNVLFCIWPIHAEMSS